MSDDEEEEPDSGTNFVFSDEEDIQTPQDKRLKLAKKYLDEVEKEEKNRADDKDVHSNVSKRLNDEQLDSVGKLRKKIADNLSGFDADNLKRLKHKLHKLPVTCVCLSSDNSFLFTGSKTQFILKWDVECLKVIGSIDCAQVKVLNDQNVTKKHRPQIWSLALSTDFKFLVKHVMTLNYYFINLFKKKKTNFLGCR